MLLKNLYALLPIIILSVVSLGLIINKSIYFYKIRIKKQKRIDFALNKLLQGRYKEAFDAIQTEKSPTADIIKYEAKLLGEGNRTVFSYKVEALAQRKIFEMEKNVTYLSSIANMSTLMGLLGTVTGMIFTFYEMMVSKSSDPYTLAGGISQALLTTAAGLITAIPAMLFYSIFISIIKRHISLMESSSSEILAVKGS
ncbi:MAG: MotA/TolQ/ExbB proton channel family protein [Spirochaetales bacterium]|nr:MotA/TolQ/ExbB proton channel family protein [Spirochaetales bacterium]